MSHWRKRIGDHLDILLAESLRLAHEVGTLKKSVLARVTIDTTVQPKNVGFPTNAKLLEVAYPPQLGKLAKQHDAPLRQSYTRFLTVDYVTSFWKFFDHLSGGFANGCK